MTLYFVVTIVGDAIHGFILQARKNGDNSKTGFGVFPATQKFPDGTKLASCVTKYVSIVKIFHLPFV